MKLSNHDNNLCKISYDEYFYGLQDLPNFNVINQHEYQKLHPFVGEALSSMAVSTIGYDENGNPERFKWMIVALSNPDPHEWTNT